MSTAPQDPVAGDPNPSAPELLQRWPASRLLVWTTIFFLGLLLAIWFDGPLYHAVHHGYNYHTRPVPSALKLPTRLLRSMEDWGENVFIVCVVVVMWRMDRHRRSRILCLAMSAIFVALVIEGVKRTTGRERPEVCQGKNVFHGPSKWDAGGDYRSFPSGHAGSAASFSGSLAAFYPATRPVMVALAVGCGANRIWKERHYLSDVWTALFMGFWTSYTFARWPLVRRLCDWFDAQFSEPYPLLTNREPTSMARAA